MIDLHTHVLPGIDDGPIELTEAVEMCRLAGETGCEILVATPHQFHPFWQNADRKALEALRDKLQQEVGSAPQILLGAEIRVGATLLGDLADRASSGALSLAGSSYVLIEFDREGIGPNPETVIHELAVSGWRPIVAHPEFIANLAQNLSLMRSLQEQGALFQVTAACVAGQLGRRPQREVAAMIDAGLVDFVASDAHGTQWRPPGLQEAFTMIESRWGEAAAGRLTTANPLAVIENRPFLSEDVAADSSVAAPRQPGPRLVHRA
ncbi:MAG: CpsB/CapC family capsule biosynthesis tyrosine phosphatase [Thermoanaerobaculia bacterium]